MENERLKLPAEIIEYVCSTTHSKYFVCIPIKCGNKLRNLVLKTEEALEFGQKYIPEFKGKITETGSLVEIKNEIDKDGNEAIRQTMFPKKELSILLYSKDRLPFDCSYIR